MAVTTVSSLTESFMSGVPVPNEDMGVGKDKANVVDIPHAGDDGAEEHGNDPKPAMAETLMNTADESDDSDFDVLEVHD